MKIMSSREEILREVETNKMSLLYFGNESCGVCVDLKPKVEKLLDGDYEKIEATYIDVEKSLKLATEFQIFTIPAILVFAEGKEVIREARYLSVLDLDKKIDRYYNMLF